MPSMSGRVRVLSLVVVGLLLAGCAESRPTPTPGATGPGTPTPTATAPGTTAPVSAAPSVAANLVPSPASSTAALSVEARDLSFSPRTLEAPAGAVIPVTLHNVGRIAHNLTIDELDLQLGAAPGQTIEGQLADVPAGTYTFYCSVSGHRQAGMEGTLTVR